VISIVMPVYDISPQIELMTRKAIGTVHKNTIGEYEMIIVLNVLVFRKPLGIIFVVSIMMLL